MRQPLLRCIVLTPRTVAIAAGVIALVAALARIAAIHPPAQRRAATRFNRPQRCLVRRRHLLALARALRRSILTHNLAERIHGIPAVSSSSALAAHC